MNRSSRLPVRPWVEGSRLSRRTRASSTSATTTSTSMPLCTSLPKRSKSSVSLQKTHQSVRNVRTKSLDRQIIEKKDNRLIHDKNWQADMLRKILDYFQNDLEAVSIINRIKNLPPLTINVFVQLVNIVLKNIDTGFKDLTIANYIELLPKYLTSLTYPEHVTANMMRTANTMPTWPHILAILSWLVELANRLKICDVVINNSMYAIPNNFPQGEKRDFEILQLKSYTMLSLFTDCLKRENTEPNRQKIFENYTQELREIYDFDVYKSNQLKQSADKLVRLSNIDKEIIQKVNGELLQIHAESTNLTHKRNNMIKKIAQQEECIANIEAKITECKQSKALLYAENKKYKSKIKKLVQKFKNLPMMKQEKENQLRSIKDLVAKMDLNIEQEEDLQSIPDESDLKISQLKQEIEEKVSTFNDELFKASLEHPELKKFAIETENVLSLEFLKNVDDNIMEAEIFHLELEMNLMKEKDELNSFKKQNNERQEESVKLQKQRETALFKVIKKKEMREDQLFDFDDDVKSKNHTIQTLDKKIEKINKHIPKLDTLKAKLRAKSKEYEILKNKAQKNALSMLGVFENLEKEITHTIVPEYQEIRQELSRAIMKKFENAKPANKERKN